MKKNLMTKLLGMALVCFCCMFMLKGATVSAAMADEARLCELGELYTGIVSGQDEGSTYYKFVLDERMRVTFNLTTSGDGYRTDIFDNMGNIVLSSNAIEYTFNAVSGMYEAKPCKTLEAGTYFLEMYEYFYHRSGTTYSFLIQAEQQIKLPKGSITSLKSYKAKQVTVKCEPAEDALGYIIYYSTDNRFKSNVKVIDSPSATATIKKLKKGKRYYVKVCPYNVYDDGTYVYGQNSRIKRVVVKK